MKRIFLIIFLGILAFLPFLSLAAGLVPCGGCIEYNTDGTCKTSEPACQLCHFFVLFKNVVDFLLKYILSPLAIIMLMIGGFMYVFAYLNPSEALFGRKGGPALISQAKKLIISVVVGIIVLFLAWGIVNVIFQMLGVADWTGLKAGNWWNVIKDCPTEASPIATGNCETCDSLKKQCGVWYDNCGKYLTCPACSSGETCDTTGQCATSSGPSTQTCESLEGLCLQNACSYYVTNCNSLPAGACQEGNCCAGTCGNQIPSDAEILPWGMLGVAGWGPGNPIVYGTTGQKKTYVLRVPPGTKAAGAAFYAYDPATVFTFTFTSIPGYKWRGYDSYTGAVSYSGDAGFDFTPETMTPTPTDGFVPPGDYIVEILWTSPPYIPYGCQGCQGRVSITTGLSTTENF